MQKLIVHRLYTEAVNRQTVVDILSKHFTGFTIIPAIGYWDSVPEQSLVIEVTGVSFADVAKVAVAIKEANKQDAILYTASEVKTKLF